jgi:hypothetical protein
MVNRHFPLGKTMHHPPPPTWPKIAMQAHKMRNLAETSTNSEEREQAEQAAFTLKEQAKARRRLESLRR